MTAKVVQIEFNELSPVLLRDLMAQNALPNFRRFYESADVFTTDARASGPHLEPWVQWPTVHLGVPHEDHGIRQLGDEDAHHRPPVAEVLSEAGRRVGVCGSMNVAYGRLNGFLLVDPWNTRPVEGPDPLAPFRHTVSTMVQESSRSDVPKDARLFAFGAFMARNGLSRETVGVLVRQLASERRNPRLRWRRASVLDWLQYDLFLRLSRRNNVDFATFFSNSTAHYQHYYWRDMAPAGFAVQLDEVDDSLRDAIPYGYRSMDRLLGRFMSDFPQATLVLCTGLSQTPWHDATKITYRPHDFVQFLTLAGIDPTCVDVRPVMAEEFVIRFSSDREASNGEEMLSRLAIENEPLMRFVRNGRELIGGCAINRSGAGASRIEGGTPPSPTHFDEVFYPIHSVRSGRHSPEGALWIRAGHHRIHEEAVDLIDIAPTVLRMFDVAPPDHMVGKVLPLSA